jgi:hypothetical protein
MSTSHSHKKPKRRNEFDRTLRHASRQFPSDIARGLLHAHQPIDTVAWADTQVTGRERRLDRALCVQGEEQQTLLHVEWTLRMTKRVEFRAFEYNSLTALAVADQAQAGGSKAPLPHIESVVVVLTGRKRTWPSHGAYQTSSPAEPFSGVHFRIEPVYQRTVAELVAKGPFWMIFAPLAVDADEKKLAQVVKLLRAQTTPNGYKELAVAMGVMVEADRRERGFRDVVRSLLPRELVMQNWISLDRFPQCAMGTLFRSRCRRSEPIPVS